MSDRSVPAMLQRRFGDHAWTPVSIGHTEARVWRLEGRQTVYLKAVAPAAGEAWREELERETAVLSWLAGYDVGAPEVVDADRTGDGWDFLATVAVPGHSGAEPWPASDRAAVVDSIVRYLERLHGLPVDACPFDRRLPVRLTEARAQLEYWKSIPGWISQDRPGWTALQMEEALEKAAAASVENPVVCHGDYMLPNVILDPDSLEVNGIVDVGALGVADRYADLVAMHWSLSGGLNPQYGDEGAERFMHAATGGEVDADKLNLYQLLADCR